MTCGIDILVTEDDENDRYLLLRALATAERRFSVMVACDGQEAVEQLESLPLGSKPKLLLLDLKMPRMDGFQVLEWLRSHPERRPARVVVLSSSVDPRDGERSGILGADLHLTKPHDAREFVQLARTALELISDSSPMSTAPSVP